MATGTTTITPSSTFDNAAPTIGVEIWPHNGGQLVFNGGTGGVLSATIRKNIRVRDGGTFDIHIVAGGPSGIEDFNTWTRLLTPASLVIIYISRAGSNRIVMLGLLATIEESQAWLGNRVVRTVHITGADFTYFFNSFNYYTLAYLGFIPLSSAAAAGWIIGKFKGQFQGSPSTCSENWLTVMLGENSSAITPGGASGPVGVLGNTFVTYQGTQILLRQFFAHWFEDFTDLPSSSLVPLYVDLFSSESAWYDRFQLCMPFPYYEFFVTTADATDYPNLSSPDIQISVPGYESLWPAIVGRVNPLPWVIYSTDGKSATLNDSRWTALPIYSLGNFSFIRSEVQYNTDEAYNFFGVNTLIANAMAQKAGTSDANLFGLETFGAVIDNYSISTYGYRPNFAQLRWYAEPPTSNTKPGGSTAKIDYNQAAQVLLGKLASYYIPTPNMLSGTVSFPLWPSITPGNRFIYRPFKNSDDYEFYIEGVTHTYVYGGQSFTSLEITRGLKKSEYDDPSTMIGVHIDTEERVDGVFTTRSNLPEITGAFYIPVGTLANSALSAAPYYGAPPNILVNTMPSPASTGWPPSANNAYDDIFKHAVTSANPFLSPACIARNMDWRLVKALALTESHYSLDQSAVSSTGALGIMQVEPGPPYDTTLLATDPTYNINAGTAILCQKLDAAPNLLEALADYKGWLNKGGYGNPRAKAQVDPVINLATGAGVPNLI